MQITLYQRTRQARAKASASNTRASTSERPAKANFDLFLILLTSASEQDQRKRSSEQAQKILKSMKERKNFAQVGATGRAIDKKLQECKTFCETFASKRVSDKEQERDLSRWYGDIFKSYAFDCDNSKQLANESKTAFLLRKQETAKKQLESLSLSMKVTSELNKLLTSTNKLYTLVLDFMLCYYDVDGVKHFAKVETIAYDKDNLTSEQVGEYESKCEDSEARLAKFAKVETILTSGQAKTYFVKAEYLSSVNAFFAGQVKKVLCRRKDFETLSEQDVFFYESERASKQGQDIKTLTACDKLTAKRLCNFVAYSLYPANKERAKQLQDQRKRDRKANKAVK